jgi:AbrB family looped-hinge helix DNA binding protein
MATVTSKGQITVPKEVRDALGLIPGSQVEFVLDSGRVILRKRIAPEVFQRWQGHLRGRFPAQSVDEMMEMLRDESLPIDEGGE